MSFDQGQHQHAILTEGGCSHTLAKSHDSDDWIETYKNSPGEKLQDALEEMIEILSKTRAQKSGL